jgi:hypothetical protein
MQDIKDIKAIKDDITTLQGKLNKLVESDGLLADNILNMSKDLDILINKYYFMISDEEKDNDNDN